MAGWRTNTEVRDGPDDADHCPGRTRNQNVTGPSLTRATSMWGAVGAGGHLGMRGPGLLHQVIEQSPPLIGRRGGGKTRPGALVGIRRQGELGHQQQAAADFNQAPVHAPLVIGKHPVAQQALQQTIRLGFAVALLHAHQHQEAGADGAHHRALDLDAGGGDPLQQTDHCAPDEYV
jgi:hypothetical protein